MLVTANEVRGRKKLQKMVFIAQSLGYPFPEPFDLHMWGPYSEVLTVKLKEMADWGFAQEASLPGPAGNQHYVYTPGPNAGRVVNELADDPRADAPLAELVTCLNRQDATLLEGVATVMYLRAQGKADEVVGQALSRLKPDKFGDSARVAAALHFADQLESYRLA